MDTAGRLKCPNCGALVAPDHVHCDYCGVPLATQVCPSCMRTVFVGFEHCPECGAAVVRAGAPADASCPSCKAPMAQLRLGDAQARQCGQCFGIWLEHTAFEHICDTKEDHVAVLGVPSEAPEHEERRALPQVRYLPCPGCGKLMNRTNFAHCSGVIIDTCRQHGIWFDRNELHEIVKFIESGGLDRTREREALHIAEQKRELREQQIENQHQIANDRVRGIGVASSFGPADSAGDLGVISLVVSALRSLF